MDEMRMVRELYAKPSAPSRQETIQARARLDALTRPRRRARWALPGLGLVAAATAAVVLVATNQPGGVESNGPASTTARPALLLAAEASDRAPATSGAYWFTHFRHGHALLVQGHGERYVVEQHSERKDWAGARRKAGRDTTEHYFGERLLGAAPMGAADTAAWRRDGSPPAFPMAGRPSIRVDAKAGAWTVNREKALVTALFPDGSLPELRRLPTDPERLRAYFLGRAKNRQDWQTPEQWVFEAGGDLLTGEPVPPAVRGAAYRMLARLAGVRTTGTVTDPLGRRGVAVEMSEGRTTNRLIIEPSSGRLLAQERIAVQRMTTPMGGAYPPGTTLSWDALIEASWTDSAPKNATRQPGG